MIIALWHSCDLLNSDKMTHANNIDERTVQSHRVM